MDFISNNLLGRLIRLGTGNDRFVSPPATGFGRIFTPGTPQWDTISGNEFEIYETTGALQIIIGRKALMKANGKWRHFKFKEDGKHEDLGLTPIIQRLNNPNPLQSGSEWLIETSIHRDIAGAAYIYALRGSNLAEAPGAIWNILPRFMTIHSTGNIYQQTDINKIINKYVYDQNGSASRNYTPEEILLRKLNNPSNQITPLSPFIGLNMEISNIRAAMGYRNVILRKKGAIGVLSGESKDGDGGIPLTQKERQRLEAQYQRSWGLSDDQMQVFISSAPVRWQPMSYPTKELMLFEEVDANLKRIIDMYGLNENIFSKEKASTFNNVLESERIIYQDTIIPESWDDARALSDYLGITEKGEFLMLDYTHLQALKDDEKKKAEILDRKATAFQKLVQNGMPMEEARELLGLTLGDTTNNR